MRVTSVASLITVALLLAPACRPSAVVRQATPVANLQVYRALAVQVNAIPGAEPLVAALEYNASQRLQAACRFDSVTPMSTDPGSASDLVLNLNIRRAFRGGEGLIQNPNQAVVDVLAVLSDKANDELVGSVWIRGKSPAVIVSGLSPEAQALDAVAAQVVSVMRNSGCQLERIARPVEETPPPDTTNPDQPDENTQPGLAEAEKINDEGKSLFRTGDVEGAAAKFQEAISQHPDPRFYFNLCFAYESMHRWDDALKACNAVLVGKPDQRLADKTNQRIQSIKLKRSQ